MKLKEFKNYINDGVQFKDLLVFLCEDNFWTAKQYAEAIANKNNLDINYIDSIYDADNELIDSLIVDLDTRLNVLITDTFSDILEDITHYTNTIIICKKIDKKAEEPLTGNIIEFPKLLDWHMEDYIKLVCKGLRTEDAATLRVASGDNIYKIENEANKIALFDTKDQILVFQDMLNDQNSDFCPYTVFDVTEAIIRQNMRLIADWLSKYKNSTFTPQSLVSNLLTKFKQIALANYAIGMTPEQLNVQPRQFNAIRYYYKDIGIIRLEHSIKFLSDIDLKIKSGILDLEDTDKFNYIVTNLIGGC